MMGSEEMYDKWQELRRKRQDMREKGREQAESIFKLAGVSYTHVWELANGYWPDSPEYDKVRCPWWLFLTSFGPVQIGWRKSVLHIEWTACEIRAEVTKDDVTKDDTYVHAWSVEKAVTYVRELARLASIPEDAAK